MKLEDYTREQLEERRRELEVKYENFRSLGLKLDLSCASAVDFERRGLLR